MFGALPNGMLNEGLTPKIPTAAGTGFGTAPTPPSGLSWLMQDGNAARGKDSGPNGPGMNPGSVHAAVSVKTIRLLWRTSPQDM